MDDTKSCSKFDAVNWRHANGMAFVEFCDHHKKEWTEEKARDNWEAAGSPYHGIWEYLPTLGFEDTPYTFAMEEGRLDIAYVDETCSRIFPLLLQRFPEKVDLVAEVLVRSETPAYFDLIDGIFFKLCRVPRSEFRRLDEETWPHRHRHPKHIRDTDGAVVLQLDPATAGPGQGQS